MMIEHVVDIDKNMIDKYNRTIFHHFYNVHIAIFLSYPLFFYLISILIEQSEFDISLFLIFFVLSEIPQIYAIIKSRKYSIHKPVRYSFEFFEDSFQVTIISKKEIETVSLLYSKIKKIYHNDLYMIILGSDNKKYIIDKLSLDKEKYMSIITIMDNFVPIKEIR